MAEIDATTIGGRCNFWCVANPQPEATAGRGERQRQGVVDRGTGLDVAPRTPSCGSDAGSDCDMFESARLGIALEQLMDDRDNLFLSARGAPQQEVNLPCSPSLFSPRTPPLSPMWRSPRSGGSRSNRFSIGTVETGDSDRDSEAPRTIWHPKPHPWSPPRAEPARSTPQRELAGPKAAATTAMTQGLRMSPRQSLPTSGAKDCPLPESSNAPDQQTIELYERMMQQALTPRCQAPPARAFDAPIASVSHEPTVRAPHAAALCRSTGAVPQVLFGKVVRGRGQLQSTSLHHGMSGSMTQDGLQAVLRQMPLPNLSVVQDKEQVDAPQGSQKSAR